MSTPPATSAVGIAREILTPVVGGIAGFFAAHGLALTPDQQATAVTLAATGAVALERWIMRAITPKTLPPPSPATALTSGSIGSPRTSTPPTPPAPPPTPKP